ncbi:uncharacterized protein ppp1r3ab [Poeciliopsis prolifica]|uniref:uncharacterized protein ppp1r3ab n=1 Tax=Poeciliopsis prolifica TaxID=188132 RepID=UPI002413093B|nr:uncharacterized protein ppp1r3ab [Poeciliopsis prolifica]
MEFAGRPRPSEACNYLAVPGLSGLYPDEDEDDLVVGFRPKSSPIPSRRSSFSDEDSDLEPPYCSSRRVSFADAKGLSLVQVKEFATWDVPKLPGSDSIAVEGKDSVEYHLSPLTFSLPLPSKEVLAKVLSQKVELETIGLLPGTTILKGVVRVLNISYNKSVYIRTSLDRWATHFDLLAEYVPGSSDGVTDSFSFKLTLGPPFGDQGVRVDFCLRYETPVGTFWANNNSRNYVLSCQRGMKGGTEKPQRENANKKSCLKTTSQSVSTVENISSKPASSQENMSTDESVWGPEVGTLKTKKTSERQSTASTREGQKLLMENKQNSSRRRQRQAARMARLRDFYTQRDGGENDPGKDETPTETKQVTREEAPGDNVVSLQPFNEGQVKSECPQFVFEALDQTSTEQVKSDLAVLARGESAPDVSNNPLDSDGEPAPEEQPNTSKSVTTNQDGDVSLPCTSSSATARSETLISQSNSFTFCTLVAPLYCQTFQRVSAENPVNTGDFSLPSELTQTCGVVPVSTRSNMGKDLTSTQGSSDESLSVKLVGPTSVEKNTLNKIPKHFDIVENPTEMEKKSNQSLGQQCPVEDNVNSQTEAQEDILAYGAPQCQSTEQNVSPGSAKVEGTLSKDESKEDLKDFWIMLEHIDEGVDLLVNGVQEKICESAEVSKENESRKTALVKDKLLQIFDELNTNLTDSKVCLNSLVYLCEPERTNLTSLAASSETQEGAKETEAEGNESTTGEINEMYEVTQSIINDMRSNNECHANMTGRHKHQNVVEETEQCETDPPFLKQDEDLLLIDTVEEKNWEKMVEEEENCVLSNEEERELLHLTTETSKTEENVEEVKVQIAVELESQAWLGKEFQQAKARKTDGTESTEVDTIKVAEQQIETERQWMSMEKARLREEEEKMETDMKQDIIIPGIEAEELVVTDADSDMTKQNNEDEPGSFKVGTGFTQNKVEDDLSTLVSRAAKNCPSERQYASIQRDTLQSHEEEELHSKKDDQSNTHTKHLTSKGDMCDSGEEPDSASAELDSDEELRLYVRCLRAPQVHTDKIREAGFTARKRPSIRRGKVPTTSMPSISEALDEEQQHSSPLETDEDVKTAAEARANTQESIQQTERRWKDLFSCDKVSKTLLYASLMVVFTVVAYHYDFLACFLLYLISVIWLCCQRERDPIKNK